MIMESARTLALNVLCLYDGIILWNLCYYVKSLCEFVLMKVVEMVGQDIVSHVGRIICLCEYVIMLLNELIVYAIRT